MHCNYYAVNYYSKGLVQSPCGKIDVIRTWVGGQGGGILVHDVLQLHCQQTLAVIMHSCG